MIVLEQWKPVIGWEGYYEVSNLGAVRSVSTSFRASRRGRVVDVRKAQRVLRTYLTAGYPSVALCRNGEQRTEYVHKLVCESFHGSMPFPRMDVAHCDGNRLNNRAQNLRWATRTENLADKLLHGTQKRGEQLWFSKLTDEEVSEIKGDTTMSNRQWADAKNVSPSLISAIRSGKRRVHVAGAL